MTDEKTVQLIEKSFAPKEAELCLSAYRYADEMHKEQKRASGEPYIIHPVAVATILM